jgi:tetraacyldisaccharide 4'-kinase
MITYIQSTNKFLILNLNLNVVMAIFRILLLPFSFLYAIVVVIRNKFYDWHFFKSYTFNTPIISVGNLEVGGSGKTPLVEYLIKLLNGSHKLSTLSRGYGRKTKGFRWIDKNDEAYLSGDEPLQIKQKFPNISVAVCENRVEGIEKIKENHSLILMDDAYQHRAVIPGLSILLFDYNRLNSYRFLLPAGNYREPFSGRKRADIIIISKTPTQLSKEEQQLLKNKLKIKAHQKVFFSYIKYASELNHLFLNHSLEVKNINKNTEVLLITGIAKPDLLLAEISKYTNLIKHHSYSDHHQFSTKNMLKLVKDFENINSNNKIIITTEKDAVRLKSEENRKFVENFPIYEWPIEAVFHTSESENFDKEILKYVRTH